MIPIARSGSGRRPGGSQAWLAGLTMLAVAIVLAGFLLLAHLTGEPFSYFSKEPAETFDVPRYIGWQAHTVVLITMVGVSCALFAALVTLRLGGERRGVLFLTAMGAFTFLLVLDDFMQFHESVYPRLTGLTDHQIYPIYAVLLALIVWRWGRPAVSANVGLFLLAGAWLGVSVGIDVLFTNSTYQHFHIFEDGAKMMGFALWSVFLVREGLRVVMASTMAAGAARSAPRHVDGMAR